MPNLKRQARQQRALVRLQEQLKTGKYWHGMEIPASRLEGIKQEIENITNPKKKIKIKTGTEQPVEKWFIDVYAIKYGYVKNSERRKNKGKSKKKMKRVKTLSFLKSMVAQTGMIQAFKEGRMGMSPKFHVFKLRREDLSHF